MDRSERYYKYAAYIKKRYGRRVQRVTIDGGFSCPNRDGSKGSGGCIYCDNKSFSPALKDGPLSITEQIDKQLIKLKRRYRGASTYLAYFQPHSNTYAPLQKLKTLYEEALSHPDVIGLVIATRPDCINAEKLSYLQALSNAYDISIEYGLESMSDETLTKINRGHDFAAFVSAIKLSREFGIKVGAHIILGFPWEDKELWLETADVLSELKIDFLKIHQLHIVKDTELARIYAENPFPVLAGEEYLDILVKFIERLRPDIVVQKLFSEVEAKYLVSDRWVKDLSQWTSTFEEKMEKQDTWQGRLCLVNNNSTARTQR